MLNLPIFEKFLKLLGIKKLAGSIDKELQSIMTSAQLNEVMNIIVPKINLLSE